ncbi:hypothetical protein BO78DRAFT_408988 [Aspergillus sclerotiicarbonarius CBS 121057]|uniref:BZIP domain-containing protein n=1 Tax=Aspergillus sclerotiicarbonarius (strain CBS 121057 / IBT 28362) TaxID=1448318 RepID=A0A319FDQ2_ASPSB|nr:hypothetical protein BO78DRAFT_408988 [Aspergillus sclerotiicarbonarius CBS 121057]
MAEQAPFGQPGVPGAISAASSQFTAANTFVAADFLPLSLEEEENIWTFGTVSQSMPTWQGKSEPQVFSTNPGLEQSLKNSHVRNGQPTPPPIDGMYQLSQYQPYDGSAYVNPTPRGSFSQQARPSEDGSTSKRRRTNAAKSSSPTPDGQEAERLKREKFLERNRVAASKCRLKKKQHTEELQNRHKELVQQKGELNSEVDRLRGQVLSLKNEMLRHSQCGDEAITVHLSQMVKNITYRDTAASEMRSELDSLTSRSPNMVARPQGLSFGFDSPIQMQSTADSLEVTPRRDSLVSEASYSFTDDAFEELIDV